MACGWECARACVGGGGGGGEEEKERENEISLSLWRSLSLRPFNLALSPSSPLLSARAAGFAIGGGRATANSPASFRRSPIDAPATL